MSPSSTTTDARSVTRSGRTARTFAMTYDCGAGPKGQAARAECRAGMWAAAEVATVAEARAGFWSTVSAGASGVAVGSTFCVSNCV